MLSHLFSAFRVASAIYFSLFIMQPFNALANITEYGIEVNGQGSVLAEPDVFSLSITLNEKGHFTDKMRAIVDHKSNQVVDVAKKLNIDDKNITSARIYLRVIKEEQADIKIHGVEVNYKTPNDQKSKVHVSSNGSEKVAHVKPQYFELSRNITIKFSDIKDYDQFINAIIKIGVSHISPLSMSVGDTDKYYRQALSLALEKAKAKATQIANQTAQNLGVLLYVKETSSNHYRAQYSSTMILKSASSHESLVGSQKINASVLVKYAFK